MGKQRRLILDETGATAERYGAGGATQYLPGSNPSGFWEGDAEISIHPSRVNKKDLLNILGHELGHVETKRSILDKYGVGAVDKVIQAESWPYYTSLQNLDGEQFKTNMGGAVSEGMAELFGLWNRSKASGKPAKAAPTIDEDTGGIFPHGAWALKIQDQALKTFKKHYGYSYRGLQDLDKLKEVALAIYRPLMWATGVAKEPLWDSTPSGYWDDWQDALIKSTKPQIQRDYTADRQRRRQITDQAIEDLKRGLESASKNAKKK